MNDVPIDVLRKRWRRERARVNLEDTNRADFGTGGLAVRLDLPSMRLLILPPDPEGNLLEFDKETWGWSDRDWPDPAREGRAKWGHRLMTGYGLVWCENRREQWSRYVALHRHGGLELGLGGEASAVFGDVRRFWLTNMVGRIWSVLAGYGEIISQFPPAGRTGPWEVTLALIGTARAQLSGTAQGWADVLESSGWSPAACPEDRPLHRREIANWPSDLHDLAFALGRWIVNAWGYAIEPFVARDGPYAGRLDAMKYRPW